MTSPGKSTLLQCLLFFLTDVCPLLPQRTAATIRSQPVIVISPVILFVVLSAIGTWAIYWSAAQQDVSTRVHTVAVAHSTALSIELSLFVALQPALVMATFVREFPFWGTLLPKFSSIGRQILDQSQSEVRFLAWGFVTTFVHLGVCNISAICCCDGLFLVF